MSARYHLWYDRLIPGAMGAMALWGAYNHMASLVALSTTALFTLMLTRLWSYHSVRSLLYERQTNNDRAFAGDELSLEVHLSNDKLLPLLWMKVDDKIPKQVALMPEGGGSPLNWDGWLKLAGSVSWQERLTWRYRVRCTRRGIYLFGPATITSGDPFGFFPRSREIGEENKLVVYPRLIPLEQLGLPPGFPLGEARPRRWIFEDPSRMVGVRDYRREDSLRRIHWKATARRQQLQVKLFEPTTTLEVALFLGLDTFLSDEGTLGRGDGEREEAETRGRMDEGSAEHTQDSALSTQGMPPSTQHSALSAQRLELDFEYAVSVVASLAHLLIGQRYPVGLYLNSGVLGSDGVVELPPGGSQEQLIRILELLAGVEPQPGVSTEQLIFRVIAGLPWGSSVVVVVGSVSKSLLEVLQAAAKRGQRPVVLSMRGDADVQACDGVVLHRLSRAGGEQ